MRKTIKTNQQCKLPLKYFPITAQLHRKIDFWTTCLIENFTRNNFGSHLFSLKMHISREKWKNLIKMESTVGISINNFITAVYRLILKITFLIENFLMNNFGYYHFFCKCHNFWEKWENQICESDYVPCCHITFHAWRSGL